MKSAFIAGLLASLAAGGCKAIDRQRPAMGDVTSVIVVAADSLWTPVEDSVVAALGPRVFTVRDERTFEITQISPASDTWPELRRFRQIVVIGLSTDPWVEPVLGGAESPVQLPALIEKNDVWARAQSVTAIVLPAGDEVASMLALLPQLATLLDDRFRLYALNRMFLSDSNVALRDSLGRDAGFSILLPNIYQATQPSADVWAFHSRSEVGGDLFRTIMVARRSGIEAGLDSAGVLAWRDSILELVYDEPQMTLRDRVEVRRLETPAGRVIEVSGAWAGLDPTFPTGGPFVDRVVSCPGQDGAYLLEAWMYGPSRRKYEYMIQFETILDSFRCGG